MTWESFLAVAEKKTENGQLQQQIRHLGQVAENHVQGAQGDASHFKKQYEHCRRQATEPQQEVLGSPHTVRRAGIERA
jgi:hypothetical protein